MTAGTSQFYGLQKLGPGESFSLNDQAFTRSNIDKIDRMFYQSLNHEHSGNSLAINDPDSSLEVALSLTGGNIPAGQTVRYKFAWVDPYGSESAASPEVLVTTPPPIEAPDAPALSLTSTGGVLLQGNYFYRLSAYEGANTNETTAGGAVYFTIPSGTANILTLTLPTLPSMADGFNVYRRSPGEVVYSYLTSIDMTVATPPSSWDDDGSISVNPNRQPTNINMTNSSNSVTVTIPGATPTVPENYTWKVYRTYTAGNWASSLVHWVVEETSEGSGIITPEYTDIGGATSTSSPLSLSEFVDSPGKVDLTDGANVDGILPPTYIAQLVEVNFAFPGTLSVQTGSFVWPCTWNKAQIRKVTAVLGRDSSPSAQSVIVDVNKYNSHAATPSWASVYTSQATRPAIVVGEFWAESTPQIVDLFDGDMLSVDIDQAGGGATPTDQDLLISVSLWVLADTNETDTPDSTSIVFAGYP